MPYTFQPFLDALATNWYEDDPLLPALLGHYARPGRTQESRSSLATWGERVAEPLRELAEDSARPEHAPRLVHFDAYGRRVDDVVLPASTHRLLAEVGGGERLGVPERDPFELYARGYLWDQNGEAGVGCALACTDGLVRALTGLGDHPEHTRALARMRGSTAERFWHAAQFVTERQGGSDVPANELRAEPDGDGFRLFGRKWFCSNVNADYFLVTARPAGAPEGSRGIALFLVPARLEDGLPLRNGYTIDRLKDKLGTRELATAELTFDGAMGWPIGALDRGLPNLLRYVLTTSRMMCVRFAAGALRRAERIATTYAEFRTAFGRRIVDFPALATTLDDLAIARARSLACFFELVRLWHSAEEHSPKSSSSESPPFDFRVLLSLCKAELCRDATAQLHEAMIVLGGNGIEERFSSLPRLFRDAFIMEVWEGPRNVLHAQALRDVVRYDVDAAAFIERALGQPRPELAAPLENILAQAAHDAPAAAAALGRLAPLIVYAMGDHILASIGYDAGPLH